MYMNKDDIYIYIYRTHAYIFFKVRNATFEKTKNQI